MQPRDTEQHTEQKIERDTELARHAAELEDRTLPTEYRPPTSELIIQDARRQYYEREDSPMAYADIVAAYRLHAEIPSPSQSSSPREEGQQPRSLVAFSSLPRDALAEYRERHGLDALREKLLSELVKAASVQKGIDFLIKHLETTNCPAAIRMLLKTSEELSEQQKVELAYPDLTADEVSWLALIDDFSRVEHKWIGDASHPQFYPPSLIGMDPTGLRFANNSEGAEDHSRLTPISAEELTGVTGRDEGNYYYPFRHNVAEGIKALINLSLNEGDIFEELQDDEAIMSMRQGDSILMQAFVVFNAEKFGIDASQLHRKISDLVAAPDNTLTHKDLDEVRRDIARYLSGCRFCNTKGKQQPVAEVVKLFGLLERLPAFVLEQKPFDGLVLFHSGSLQFVDVSGSVVDSIPLIEHLRIEFCGKLNEQADTVALRNKVTRSLFAEISERITKRNIDQGNKMKLDRLQEKILFDHNIIVPIKSLRRLETATTVTDFFMSRSGDANQFRQFLKFGHFELTEIDSMLNELPPYFKHGVKIFRKGALISASDSILFAGLGNLVKGFYVESSQAVCVNIPEFGPQVNRDYLGSLLSQATNQEDHEELARQMFEDDSVLLKLQHDYFHVIIHEIAEAVAARHKDDLIEAWAAIDKQATKAERKNPRSLYVSRYATTDPKEDFCECCAVYFLAGDTFRSLAKRSPILARKYQFMKMLFSSDGTTREYRDRYPHHLYEILGDPDRDWEEIRREHFAVQFEARENQRERDLRDSFSDRLVSYEDVAEIIHRLESKGIEVSPQEAVRRAFQKQREREEQRDDLDGTEMIFHFILEKAIAVAQEYKVAGGFVEENMYEVFDAIFGGNTRALRGLLKTAGNKPISLTSAGEIVRKLQPLVKQHFDVFDTRRMRHNQDSSEGGENFAALLSSLVQEWNTKK